jgi:hypothetical protein
MDNVQRSDHNSTDMKVAASGKVYRVLSYASVISCTFIRIRTYIFITNSANSTFIAVGMNEITDYEILGGMLRNEIGDGCGMFRYSLSSVKHHACRIIVLQSTVIR